MTGANIKATLLHPQKLVRQMTALHSKQSGQLLGSGGSQKTAKPQECMSLWADLLL